MNRLEREKTLETCNINLLKIKDLRTPDEHLFGSGEDQGASVRGSDVQCKTLRPLRETEVLDMLYL